MINGESGRLVLKANSQTHQEVMSQRDQQHMMMPTQPTACFVVVKTDFAFGFFEDGFNRPAHAADAHELAERRIGGRIAEVVFDHRRVIQIAAEDQPELAGGQIAARLGHAQEGKFASNRTFTAFFDDSLTPVFCGDVSHQLLHCNGTLARVAQTQAGWMAAATLPLGNMHLRLGAPDRSGALDLGEIPLVQIFNSISKSRRIPVQFIRSYPVEGQMAAFFGFLEQFQPNFWLCLMNQVFWHATSTPSLGVFPLKPLVGHEQPPLDQTIAFATGIPQINSHLSIRHLADRSAVLRCYPNRIITLLDRTRFINQCNSIFFPQRFAHRLLMNGNHRFLFPRTLTNKVLHTTYIFTLFQSHLFNILARRLTQQAAHIGLAPPQLLHALKSRFEHLHVVHHFTQNPFKIFFAQIAFGRRTGFDRLNPVGLGYNLGGHGLLRLLLTWLWLEKDTMPSYSRLLSLPCSNFAL